MFLQGGKYLFTYLHIILGIGFIESIHIIQFTVYKGDPYTEKAKATLQNKGIIEGGRSRIILTTRGNEIIDKIEILINGKWYNKAELYLKDYIGWITLITLIIAVCTFAFNIYSKN